MTATEPAVRQSQSMSGLQGIGHGTGSDSIALMPALGPRWPHRLGECCHANPFHDQGWVVLQTELEHGMMTMERAPTPFGAAEPIVPAAAGSTPGVLKSRTSTSVAPSSAIAR